MKTNIIVSPDFDVKRKDNLFIYLKKNENSWRLLSRGDQMKLEVKLLDLSGLIFTLLSPTLRNRWVGEISNFPSFTNLSRWGRLCLPCRYHTVSTLNQCWIRSVCHLLLGSRKQQKGRWGRNSVENKMVLDRFIFVCLVHHTGSFHWRQDVMPSFLHVTRHAGSFIHSLPYPCQMPRESPQCQILK